jgi:hypothetical protein
MAPLANRWRIHIAYARRVHRRSVSMQPSSHRRPYLIRLYQAVYLVFCIFLVLLGLISPYIVASAGKAAALLKDIHPPGS